MEGSNTFPANWLTGCYHTLTMHQSTVTNKCKCLRERCNEAFERSQIEIFEMMLIKAVITEPPSSQDLLDESFIVTGKVKVLGNSK